MKVFERNVDLDTIIKFQLGLVSITRREKFQEKYWFAYNVTKLKPKHTHKHAHTNMHTHQNTLVLKREEALSFEAKISCLWQAQASTTRLTNPPFHFTSSSLTFWFNPFLQNFLSIKSSPTHIFFSNISSEIVKSLLQQTLSYNKPLTP